MFTPKYIEDGRALEKAAQKIINYRRDVARPDDLDRVHEQLQALRQALKKRSAEEVQKAEKKLLPALSKVHPVRGMGAADLGGRAHHHSVRAHLSGGADRTD